jgi:hypothetical protein
MIKIISKSPSFKTKIILILRYILGVNQDLPLYYRETLPWFSEFSKYNNNSFEVKKTENWIDNPDP